MIIPDPRKCTHSEEKKIGVTICTAARLHTWTRRRDIMAPTYGSELLTDVKDEEVPVCLECVRSSVRREARSIIIPAGVISIVAAIVAASTSIIALVVIGVLVLILGVAGLIWGLSLRASCVEENAKALEGKVKRFAECLYLYHGLGQPGRVVLYGERRKRLELWAPESMQRFRENNPDISKDLPEDAQVWELSGLAYGRTYYILPEVESDG